MPDQKFNPNVKDLATRQALQRIKVELDDLASAPPGGVTDVNAAPPLTSTHGASPTISLDDTAVSPGSYVNTNLTVDQKGRLTLAASGSVGEFHMDFFSLAVPVAIT